MVLNTTYFMSQEKTGDAFSFFQTASCSISQMGLAMLMALSQFSLRGLRRLVFPLLVISVAMLLMLYIPHLGMVRGGARTMVTEALAPMSASARWSSRNSRWYFFSRIF